MQAKKAIKGHWTCVVVCELGVHSQHQASLLQSLRGLQLSHDYSDLEIFCQDEVFHVHKAIICPRSKYFRTSCKWAKDGKQKEEIDLAEENSKLIGLMIDYFYQLDYDDLLPSQGLTQTNGDNFLDSEAIDSVQSSSQQEVMLASNTGVDSNEPMTISEAVTFDEQDLIRRPESDFDWGLSWGGGVKKTKKKSKKSKEHKRSAKPRLRGHSHDVNTDRLVVNTLMYALADKFDIKDLKDLAVSKFEEAVVQDWDTQAFAHAAELAFSTTHSSDKGLRDVVTRTLNEHRDLSNYEEIQSLLDSGNGMAWAFVQVLLAE